jgi:hypothetical protein
MNTNLIIKILFVCIMPMLFGCTPTPIYEVGDIGPAGGYIFYREYTDGWRYIEAAPADVGKIQWGLVGSITNANGKAVWTGKSNTETIYTLWPASFYAGTFCHEYESGGYDDWYLPSLDELMLMYTELKQNGLGAFEDAAYYTSTDQSISSDVGATFVEFSVGVEGAGMKNAAEWVRPVRDFVQN